MKSIEGANIMSETITIREISAKPGTKAFGFLKVAERPGSSVELPLGIVNGSEPGPILCLTAGMHAVEYPGINAVIRLYKQTDPATLRGALLTVPVINIPGFDTGTDFVCPIDNKNIGLVFPGKKTGTISQRIAYTLIEEILSKADNHIDLHGGGTGSDLIPFVIFSVIGNEQLDKKVETMARLYGTEYVEKTGMNKGIKMKKAIPSFIGEYGCLGKYEEADIASHVRGVTNVMKYLGMLEGKPSLPGRQLVFETGMPDQPPTEEQYGYHTVNTNRGGLLFPKVKVGDQVQEGQLLGEVMDLKGDIIDQMVSPITGAIFQIYPTHVVNAGDMIFFVVPVEEFPPLELDL